MSVRSDKRKHRLWTAAFAALNVAVIAVIAFREFGKGGGAAEKLSQITIRPVFLLGGAALFLATLISEILKYDAMIRATGNKPDLKGACECAILGKYYDNITPMGAGGQPFQMIYLKKRGYSAGVSGALPIMGFLSLQFAFVLIALAVFFCNGSVIGSVTAIRVAAYVGLLCYAFFPVCIVWFSQAPGTLTAVASAVTRFLGKLRLVKDPEKTAQGAVRSLEGYCESFRLLERKPVVFAEIFLLSVIYRAALLSMPYFVLRAFGGASGFWQVFSLCTYIYAAITIIPTPGNSGAAEGSFYMVFSAIGSGALFWAMLAWRLLCYYSWLALGLLLYAVRLFRKKQTVEKGAELRKEPSAAEFVDVFYPTVDGVIRTVYSYALRLNRQTGCCVICPRAAAPFRDDFDFSVVRVPALRIPGLSYRLPLPGLSRELSAYLKSHSFGVFHAHSPFTMGRYAVRMGRRLGIPVIATFHSKYYDDVLNITHSRLLARVVTRRIVRFYDSADEVWACSAGTADTLRGYGFRGPIKVVDNGIDAVAPENPGLLREEAEDALTFPTDKHILLFVGQQIWQKNLRLVLDTASVLKRQGDNYLTVIAGCGYNQRAIMDYAAELGLGKSVRFLGQITDRDLLQGVYLASDLFFFPSFYDNAPLVVREAAAMGVPSLLVAGSNAAERVTDGVNGYIEENDSRKMAEKIQRVFASGELSAVGRRAQQTIPVSWDVIVAEVAENYRGVMQRCCVGA